MAKKLWMVNGTLARNADGTVIYDNEQQLQCCCCDLTGNSCDPPLEKSYNVTIPTDCVLTTCGGDTNDFGGAVAVVTVCIEDGGAGLASLDWLYPAIARTGSVAGTWEVALYWVPSQWRVAAWRRGDNTNCRIQWAGPTTPCDPTGTYTYETLVNSCVDCAKTSECEGNVVVS